MVDEMALLTGGEISIRSFSAFQELQFENKEVDVTPTPNNGVVFVLEFSIPTADYRFYPVATNDRLAGSTQQTSCGRSMMKGQYGALPRAYGDLIQAAVRQLGTGVTRTNASCTAAYCIDPFSDPFNDDLTGNAC